MKKNKKKLSVLALALVLCLAIAGISAYFTDGDTVTNEFTVGKVEIDLQEEEFVETDYDVNNLTPKMEIAKDPDITNTGINDAYVFLEVVVPCANVQTAEDDGEYIDAAKTELFSWTVNPGWAQVEVEETDAANTYVYAWVGYTTSTDATSGNTVYVNNTTMAALAKDATTDTLFDYVRFANVTENSGLETVDLEIVVNAYAIQTSNIDDNDAVDGSTAADIVDGDNADGTNVPAAVWAVVENELPSTTADAINGVEYNEDASTDVNGSVKG